MRLRALVYCAVAFCLVSAQVATAKTPTGPAVLGGWHGKYVCGQGVTALRLIITEPLPGKGKPGGITATFRFGPAPENPEVPRGLYAMAGSYEARSRHVQLKGVAWIDATSGYTMVDLDGHMDVDGKRLSGKVPFPGCTVFELERDAQLVG